VGEYINELWLSRPYLELGVRTFHVTSSGDGIISEYHFSKVNERLKVFPALVYFLVTGN
jgi:hypothetical protein